MDLLSLFPTVTMEMHVQLILKDDDHDEIVRTMETFDTNSVDLPTETETETGMGMGMVMGMVLEME